MLKFTIALVFATCFAAPVACAQDAVSITVDKLTEETTSTKDGLVVVNPRVFLQATPTLDADIISARGTALVIEIGEEEVNIRAGDRVRLGAAQNVEGRFSQVIAPDFAGVLVPQVEYGTDYVDVVFRAGLFANVPHLSVEARRSGAWLDDARPRNIRGLRALYTMLDRLEPKLLNTWLTMMVDTKRLERMVRGSSAPSSQPSARDAD